MGRIKTTPEWYRTHRSELSALRNAIHRCHNPDATAYKNYGARGIEVCSEWRDNPTAFFNHVGPKPTPQHTLDRIDNDKGYEPGNVRWATRRQQSKNRRVRSDDEYSHKTLVKHKGKTQTLCQWARELGLSSAAIRMRWYKGLRGADLLTPRQRACRTYVTYQGEVKSLSDWCLQYRIDYPKAVERLSQGYTIADIIEGRVTTTGRKPYGMTITYRGKTQTISQWAKEIGITANAITSRYRSNPDDLDRVFYPGPLKKKNASNDNAALNQSIDDAIEKLDDAITTLKRTRK